MALQEFLLQKFKIWKPTAPEEVARTKRDITLSWKQEEFEFLEGDLLYRVEKNNKLPKWIVVYSGGKTSKRIDNLAPSHPHKFKLKVILKAIAVPHITEKALQYYGDENSVYEKFNDKNKDTVEENKESIEYQNLKGENGGGDNIANIAITVEDISEDDFQQSDLEITNLSNTDKLSGQKTAESETQRNTDELENHEVQSNSRCLERQGWLESLYSEELWTSTDTEGTSVACFCMAVKCGYIKQVQSMLEERPDLVGIVNAGSGFTPLGTAVRRGDMNTSRFLLSVGAELEQRSSAGQSALHLAVLHGHPALVELLLEKGAEFQARDWNGLRVEHYAVDSCNLDMMKLIFDIGGDVKVKDFNGWTPLFRALCQGAKTAVIEELVSRGSDVDAVDIAGLPLTSAAKLLKNRHGRSRGSVLSLVDAHYPHEKALANFTRLTKKIYNVHTLFKLT